MPVGRDVVVEPDLCDRLLLGKDSSSLLLVTTTRVILMQLRRQSRGSWQQLTFQQPLTHAQPGCASAETTSASGLIPD